MVKRSLGHKASRWAGRQVAWTAVEFRSFIGQGDVIQLAVGIILGTAFGAVVQSLVSDVFTPLLSLAGKTNLEGSMLVLRKGAGAKNYSTVADAKADGAVTINYGRFLDALLNLGAVALFLFILVKSIRCCRRLEIPGEELLCPECAEAVKEAARVCPHCHHKMPRAPKRRHSDLGLPIELPFTKHKESDKSSSHHDRPSHSAPHFHRRKPAKIPPINREAMGLGGDSPGMVA